MDRGAIVRVVCDSACFQAECASLRRGGTVVSDRPRLVKQLERELVRLIFPTETTEIDDGTVVALVCLYDQSEEANVYAHAIHAGAEVNAALRSLFVPAGQAKPQPGVEGHKAIQKFVAWKKAAWAKFLLDELDKGTAAASAIWIGNFWKALDRMYGGGNLIDRASDET